MPRQTPFILSLEAHVFILFVEMLYLPALHCIPPGLRSPFLLGSVPPFEVRGPKRVQLRVFLVVQFAIRAFPTLVQPVLDVVLVQRVVRFVVEPVSRTNTITVSAGVNTKSTLLVESEGLHVTAQRRVDSEGASEQLARLGRSFRVDLHPRRLLFELSAFPFRRAPLNLDRLGEGHPGGQGLRRS